MAINERGCTTFMQNLRTWNAHTSEKAILQLHSFANCHAHDLTG